LWQDVKKGVLAKYYTTYSVELLGEQYDKVEESLTMEK